jgi:hypothetical protein
MTANPDVAEQLRKDAAIEELQEELAAAYARIDTLEAQLEARRRTERDHRLARAIEQPQPPQRGPTIVKPIRPHSDEEWASILAARG